MARSSQYHSISRKTRIQGRVIENIGQNASQEKCTKTQPLLQYQTAPSLSRYNNRSETGNLGYKSAQITRQNLANTAGTYNNGISVVKQLGQHVL